MTELKFSGNIAQIQQSLSALLDRHHIDWRNWGQGDSLGLPTLAKEVQAGESVFLEDGGTIRRVVRVINIRVSFIDHGQIKYLQEDHVVLADGRTRRRTVLGAVNEKAKPGEPPSAAAHRGMLEEVGIDFDFTNVPCQETVTDKISANYVGLPCRFQNFIYNVTIEPKDYNPEGYLEKEPGKTTYFTWTDNEPEYRA
jgi:hypothetical protein